MKLILASASPRRSEILRAAGFSFETLVTGCDEALQIGESAKDLVRRLAEAKARGAAEMVRSSHGATTEPAIVIGADTVVELDGEIFGKPGSADGARQMLKRLSGRTHRVLTGIALLRLPDGVLRSAVETTSVQFAALTSEEIAEYVLTGEPLDKAGAYAVQGIAGRFVERIEGCYFNVVGLPLARVYLLLMELGWQSGHSQ